MKFEFIFKIFFTQSTNITAPLCRLTENDEAKEPFNVKMRGAINGPFWNYKTKRSADTLLPSLGRIFGLTLTPTG